MKSPQVHFYLGTRLMHTDELDRPMEIGRASDLDNGRTYAPQPGEDSLRIAIAEENYTDMSRRLLLITPVDEHRVRVENLSKSNLIHVAAQEPLWPKQQRDLTIPAILTLFDRRIEVSPAARLDEVYMSMNEQLGPPGSDQVCRTVEISSHFLLAEKLSPADRDQLTKWLGAVTRVLQSAVSSADFYDRAAKEMVELIGLDSGHILELAADGTWIPLASFDGIQEDRSHSTWVSPSKLLGQVVVEKRTFWTAPGASSARPSGTSEASAAIAAPLLDQAGNVIGALYGEARNGTLRSGQSIGTLEAMLVETLARGVAAGRARVEQERAAARAQVRFEQFFTPELSRHLAANADLLTRRDTEVSLLFCDIRRFSAISEQLGAEITMEWLSDVMGQMAECAAKYEGALVDYIGDELMIMWGAPTSQADHATRACEAALEMARQVSKFDEKWFERLGHRTQLGFGINTGNARVGNVGFERKFRYAPFGNTVNLASRVQGATKHLGVDIVATEATFQKLLTKPISRRLCKVRVVNIEEPVVLYELRPDDSTAARELCRNYEQALGCFESDSLPEATRILSDILREHPHDGPSLLLLSRAVECLRHHDESFSSVFELAGK